MANFEAKQEWVLNSETVLYGSAESLKATLEYDFAQEKKFSMVFSQCVGKSQLQKPHKEYSRYK